MAKSSIVSRTMIMLEIICSSKNWLSFAEIAEKSAFPKSSAHRILMILREEGLVRFDAARNVYMPASRFLSMATDALNVNGLVDVAGTALQQLSMEMKLGATLGILDDGDVLWLKIIDYPSRHRTAPHAGDRTPAHVVSSGKVLLAFSDKLQRELCLKVMRFQAFTHRTITDKATFEAELDQVREQGLAMSNREEYLQDVSMAAPILDHNGDIMAAIGVFDMTGQLTMEDLLVKKQKLLDTAQQVSAQFGFKGDINHKTNVA